MDKKHAEEAAAKLESAKSTDESPSAEAAPESAIEKDSQQNDTLLSKSLSDDTLLDQQNSIVQGLECTIQTEEQPEMNSVSADPAQNDLFVSQAGEEENNDSEARPPVTLAIDTPQEDKEDTTQAKRTEDVVGLEEEEGKRDKENALKPKTDHLIPFIKTSTAAILQDSDSDCDLEIVEEVVATKCKSPATQHTLVKKRPLPYSIPGISIPADAPVSSLTQPHSVARKSLNKQMLLLADAQLKARREAEMEEKKREMEEKMERRMERKRAKEAEFAARMAAAAKEKAEKEAAAAQKKLGGNDAATTDPSTVLGETAVTSKDHTVATAAAAAEGDLFDHDENEMNVDEEELSEG